MEIGLGHWRLPPRDFWGLSLREYSAGIDGYRESLGETGDAPSGPLTRRELEEMKQRFPDQPKETLNA